MLKRLRVKFISIIMVIVLFMLCVMFGTIYHVTKLKLENDSLRMMKSIAATTVLDRRPNGVSKDVRLPFFTIRLGSSGTILAADGGYYDLSDEQFLEGIVQQVVHSGKRAGTIPEYHLRFCRFETPGSQLLVFADTSSEQAILDNLLRTCLLIGGLSILVSWCISFCLSQWAVAPIEKAWRQQKQFVADASHELKTPLTVITTNAELLHQDGNSEENRRLFTNSILTTSRHMRTLLEQMLDLARSDDQQADQPQTVVDFTSLLNDEVLAFEAVLYEKEHILRSQVEDGILMRGVEIQLRHLIGILLDNAGKYAEPHSDITLVLSRYGKKRCRLTVADHGEPISQEDLRNIFKRFYRVDEARAQNGSYGLGLAIAQNIAHLHRGVIWAESRNGLNQFIVELPIK